MRGIRRLRRCWRLLRTKEPVNQNTGQKADKIHEDMERDKWLTAEEAKKYGIVDQIIDDITVPQKKA